MKVISRENLQFKLLAHKTKEFEYRPEIIIAGSRLNDCMVEYVALQIVKLIIERELLLRTSLRMLGITFKEKFSLCEE